ncbi:MAG TPA: pyridoxamine 5'-phosphate oxidase family protein [Acidimicrobiales bacterium]|nr:pyridoxamine 5'-phosphate oxidase family protein [Acidimicrobiales bacterium]
MALRDTHSGLEVIERDECLRLLASRQVGRLGVVDGRRPLIFPVNYVVAGEEIVFRTDPGTKLTAALRANVALQIDEVNEEERTGWSVLVSGRAEEIDSFRNEAVRALLDLPVRPWSAGSKAHWVRIVTESVTGRRL